MKSSDDNDKSIESNHDNDLIALEVRNLSKFWDSQAGRVIGVTNISFECSKRRIRVNCWSIRKW